MPPYYINKPDEPSEPLTVEQLESDLSEYHKGVVNYELMAAYSPEVFYKYAHKHIWDPHYHPDKYRFSRAFKVVLFLTDKGYLQPMKVADFVNLVTMINDEL